MVLYNISNIFLQQEEILDFKIRMLYNLFCDLGHIHITIHTDCICK